MNQSSSGFLPAVYALLYLEFMCFSVKNRSVKVILSSDEFTTAIYVLSVVKQKLFMLSVIEPEC